MRTLGTKLGAACVLLTLSSAALATVVAVGGNASAGSTPTCGNAAPSVPVIWPPDHAYVPVIINGLDGGGSDLTVLITSIFQSEPVDATGSGNTSPDGYGIGQPTAFVRAERAGPGTGRMYFISFSATNGNGGCTGTVAVWVPHDQGQGSTPTGNEKPDYDSTVPAP